MKTKTSSYHHLADLCDVHGWHLELDAARQLKLRVKRQGQASLSTPFTLSNPDAAAKRLLEKL